ncbi:MAG: septum site-determining protein MinC [Cocleimonas sp.]|nr:septum site-determining protein MinC [Cocleimonas sp.]
MIATQSALELKGEMLMLNVLRLQDVDIKLIEETLQQKRNEAPLFFVQSPVVVDCSNLSQEQGKQLDLRALRRLLVRMDFVPVGLRNVSNAMLAASMTSGWNILRSSTKHPPQKALVINTPDENARVTENTSTEEQEQNEDAVSTEPVSEDQVNEAIENTSLTSRQKQGLIIERPIRSGQQIYAKRGDLIILSQTSAGSEVMADGSIHVYGPLRGRVLAGVKGNKKARIFCRSLEAELIVIAGCYQLLDESETELKGKPAMIHLEDEKLIIEPLI